MREQSREETSRSIFFLRANCPGWEERDFARTKASTSLGLFSGKLCMQEINLLCMQGMNLTNRENFVEHPRYHAPQDNFFMGIVTYSYIFEMCEVQ